MVRGGFGIKSKACLGWLVGLASIPPSFPFDREEGIEGCIYSSSYYQEKKDPPARTFNKRAISASPHRKGWYVCTRQTKQNKILKRSGYGAMHKVMIGFVFPIGK